MAGIIVAVKSLVDLPCKNTKRKSENGMILGAKYLSKTYVISNHSGDAANDTTSLGGTRPHDQFPAFQPTIRDTYAVDPVHSPAAKTAKVTVRKLNNATKEMFLRRETILNIRP